MNIFNLKEMDVNWSDMGFFGEPYFLRDTMKIIPYEFGPDDYQFNNKKYPGDKGKVYIFEIIVPIKGCKHGKFHKVNTRKIKVFIFDSEFIRNELLTTRLVFGKEALTPYRFTARTYAKFFTEQPDILPIILQNCAEHPILRAGISMQMNEFLPNIETHPSNFKRHVSGNMNLFDATVKMSPQWTDHKTYMPSETCGASGGTLESYTSYACISNIYLENIIYNVAQASMICLLRSANASSNNINLFFLSCGALFSIYKHDFKIHEGLVIPGGTIINTLKHDEIGCNEGIYPPGMIDFLRDIYLFDISVVADDIVGEAGEKFEENPIPPLMYDLKCGYIIGHKWQHPIWKRKLLKALNTPGILENLKLWRIDAYEYYKNKKIQLEKKFFTI